MPDFSGGGGASSAPPSSAALPASAEAIGLAVANAMEQKRMNRDMRFVRGNNLSTTDISIVDLDPSLAGKRGSILMVHDTGGGNIRISIDGTSPQIGNVSCNSINGYNTSFVPVDGVLFDNLMIDPSQANGDVEFVLEVYP